MAAVYGISGKSCLIALGGYSRFTSRGCTFTAASERSVESREDCNYTLNYPSGPMGALYSQISSCSSMLRRYFTFDESGRASSIVSPADSSGYEGTNLALGMNPTAADGAVLSVLRTASANGLVYNYYYDALKRRRLKAYPTGVMDEFFYDLGHQMLVDQGNDAVLSPGAYTTDEYVWLGGRPIAVVRGQLDTSSWLHATAEDGASVCARNGEPAKCGVYFPVTDGIGKTVLTLDGSRRVAGAYDYDPYGYPNRVSLDAETSHPYGPSTTATLADVTQPAGGTNNPSTKVDVRAQLFMLDSEASGSTPLDYVYIQDGDTAAALTAPIAGYHLGRAVTPWGATTAGHAKVMFVSNAGNNGCWGTGGTYIPAPCKSDSAASGQYASWPYQGAVMSGYEYRRYQTGATPFNVPLRFPGQYYDAETDLFENWNRYYDPEAGRYLEPEPAMGHSRQVAEFSSAGLSLPAYAYALSNPLAFDDRTGKIPDSINLHVAALIATGNIAGAIDFLESEGEAIPGWLTNMQQAFDVANRSAGPCEQVARQVQLGFQQIGQNPTFVRIASDNPLNGPLGFDLVQGVPSSAVQVSETNYHVAVEAGGRIYDAFTGPAGMTVAEYLARFNAALGHPQLTPTTLP